MSGSTLRYETEGDGPPVVFIHGLGATSDVWHAQRAVLSKYFRVIVYDRSGCGRSPGTTEGYSIDGWADELAGLLDHLDVATTVVVGHSLGSMIAQRFAAKYPTRTRALVLAGGEAALTPEGKDILTERSQMIRSQGLTAAVDPWLAGVLSAATRAANPALAGLLRAMFLAYDDATYAQQCLALRDGDVRGDHARISCPTMLLVGDQDPVTPLSWQQQIAAGITGSSIRIVPDTAHMTMLESPAVFSTALLEFLAGLESR
jgi:3-oxoadipate enol-lactonase